MFRHQTYILFSLDLNKGCNENTTDFIDVEILLFSANETLVKLFISQYS